MDKKFDVKVMPSLNLAFIGDSVYEILVREHLCKANVGKVGVMNKLKVGMVCCKAQAKAIKKILPVLTEEEQGVFRRGRNVAVNSVSKSGSLAEYHAATGLEALFGYLYLSGRESRCRELFGIIIEDINEE